MLVAQIWVSQQGQSLILSQHDPISGWLCLTLLYVDTNHWSLISQTQTSNSVGLGDRHCDGFSQPTETIEICPIYHGHGMGNHQAGIPSAQGWIAKPYSYSLLTDAKAQSMIFQAFHTQSESMFVLQALWNGVRRPKYLTIWPPLLSISRKNQATLMHHICSQKDLGGTYTGLSACMVSDLATKAIIQIYPYCLAGQNCMIKMFWYSKHSRPKLNQSVLSLSISVRAFCWKGNLFIFFDAIFSTWTLNPLSSLGQVRRWSDVSDVSVNSTLHQLESFEASEPIMLSQGTTKNLSLQCKLCKCARCSWGWLACVGLGRPQQAMCAVYFCWIG